MEKKVANPKKTCQKPEIIQLTVDGRAINLREEFDI